MSLDTFISKLGEPPKPPSQSRYWQKRVQNSPRWKRWRAAERLGNLMGGWLRTQLGRASFTQRVLTPPATSWRQSWLNVAPKQRFERDGVVHMTAVIRVRTGLGPVYPGKKVEGCPYIDTDCHAVRVTICDSISVAVGDSSPDLLDGREWNVASANIEESAKPVDCLGCIAEL